MKKIKVTREFADALESAIKMYSNHDDYISEIIKNSLNGSWAEEREILQKVPISEVSQALIAGYETEMTLEEKVNDLYNKNKKYYNKSEKFTLNKEYFNGVLSGIEDVCKVLNIELKGK